MGTNTSHLNREQEAMLLIAYKYFYRSVGVAEIKAEIIKEGLLDMTHREFTAYAAKLVNERRSMMQFFQRSDEWVAEQLSNREKADG